MIQPSASQNRNIIILLLVAAAILFSNLGGWDLWNPDEPRYAEVAREMVKNGEYLVPHINGKIYPDKPPLFFWLIALCSKPFGDVSAATARFPSAFAALCVILLTFLLGKKLYNPAVGIFAGLILLSTTQFFWLAVRANIDMTLTLWTTLAIYLLYCGYTRQQGKNTCYLLAYFFMGLATITKGPVGIFIPLITMVLFLLSQKQYRQIKDIRIVPGLLIILVTSALWLVPACISGGGEYMQNILFKQTFGRAVDSYSHKQPFFYYLVNFPADFNPWTIFIPSAVIFFWRKKKQGGTVDLTFPLVWFAGTFIFFSLVSGKRNLYLLPLYPAAAILMARFWYDFIETTKGQPSKLITIPCYILFGALTLCSIGAGAVLALGDITPLLKNLEIDPRTLPLNPVIAIFLAGGISGLALLAKKARPVFCFILIAVIMLSGFLFSVTRFFPAINVFKSGRPFCDRIAAIVKPADTLVTFRFNPESFNYFMKRSPIPVIDNYEDLKALMRSPGKVYCLIHAKYNEYAPDEDKELFTVLDTHKVGHREYYLLVNKPSIAQQ
jgi:4-amino-4-deoxy-L-arabinose transferase-like glycosyltransferase